MNRPQALSPLQPPGPGGCACTSLPRSHAHAHLDADDFGQPTQTQPYSRQGTHGVLGSQLVTAAAAASNTNMNFGYAAGPTAVTASGFSGIAHGVGGGVGSLMPLTPAGGLGATAGDFGGYGGIGGVGVVEGRVLDKHDRKAGRVRLLLRLPRGDAGAAEEATVSVALVSVT